jgi:epoxyqueuosine reductase
VQADVVKGLARECGFELAGIAPASPLPEAAWYLEWVRRGMAAGMAYLAGHRAAMRADPRTLLASVRSIICVGKLYNTPEPYSTGCPDSGRAWISRYAWGKDYHGVLRAGLKRLAGKLSALSPQPFEWRISVDTAPLLERAYARRAGLGWIGKNSCLINQRQGSWFFLGELLVSLDIEADSPPPGRCGTCRRCIDACPTGAIVPADTPGGPAFTVDSRRCISYLTIEHRGATPEALRAAVGRNVFGCDICQDVCPWNRRAAITGDPAFAPVLFAPPLHYLAGLGEEEFGQVFAESAIRRCGYAGLMRNVAVAAGNMKARMKN